MVLAVLADALAAAQAAIQAAEQEQAADGAADTAAGLPAVGSSRRTRCALTALQICMHARTRVYQCICRASLICE